MKYEEFIEKKQAYCEFSELDEDDAYFCEHEDGDLYCEYKSCPLLKKNEKSEDCISFFENSKITLDEAVKTIQSIEPYEIFKNIDTSKISAIFNNERT